MADRVERLTNLLALLLETAEPLSLEQIAQELEGQYSEKLSNRRMAFERDKATLREIGVPIDQEVQSGSDAGITKYWIDRSHYELADLDLDDDEQRALQVAMATARPGSAAAQDALWKVGAGIAPARSVTAAVPDDPNLPTLRTALSKRYQVTFTYGDLERTVDPWGLLLREGFWYLVGYDHTRDARRTFRLDRFQSSVDVDPDTSFDRPDGFRAADAFPSDPKLIGVTDDPVEAEVRITGPRASLVAREFDAERIIERTDEAVVVRVPANNEPAFRAWLFDLGTSAEVIGPPAVRDSIVAWLTEVAS